MEIYLAYAARGQTAWWRYPLTIAAALLLAVFAMTLFGAVLTLCHLMPGDLAAQITRPSSPYVFFAGIATIFGCLGIGLAAAAFVVQRKRPLDIVGRWRWSLFFSGIVIWTGVQAMLAGVDLAIAPKGFSISAVPSFPIVAMWAFAALLIQTFTEEFIFRGYLTQAILLTIKRPVPAACVSGLLFGAMHIPNGWPQALNAAWFGMVCAWIAIRTGGIALTCGIHLANNYFGAVVVVSASDVFKGSPGILIQNTPHLEWWDLFLAVLALAVAMAAVAIASFLSGGKRLSELTIISANFRF